MTGEPRIAERQHAVQHTRPVTADEDRRVRLIGIAQIPVVDIATSVRSLREAKRSGFKGVAISSYPSGTSMPTAEDDPFWEAAEEEQIPVHIHAGLPFAGKREWSAGASIGLVEKVLNGGPPGLADMMDDMGSAAQWMGLLIYSGLFDRYPSLKLVSVEVGAGWIPHWLQHLDDHWWRNRIWSGTR